MPQLGKGGKFVFGMSLIRKDYSIKIPPQAIKEYNIVSEGKVYLFSGSKSTGGFCVTKRNLLLPSQIGNILTENPQLNYYTLPQEEFVKYKGRYYCWTSISNDGLLKLTPQTAEFLKITVGLKLLCVRSSNIAFMLGAKGRLLEIAENYDGTIEVF